MIAILDIGKTNKKCLVFDEQYRVVFEHAEILPETRDEDGMPCDDLDLLQRWVADTLDRVLHRERLPLRALNASTYGASLVHLDDAGQAIAPLYNYLKPFPGALLESFLRQYGPADRLALETASPLLGNLNSGLQLYWLKHHRPEVFARIRHSLHLPQYVASLLHGQLFSDITSIGCHTLLWNFQQKNYHSWVRQEGIDTLFPALQAAGHVVRTPGGLPAGAGLHDSSAALIPYLVSFSEPFLLLSTGTWCIALNPFNEEALTPAELEQDCLCYLSYNGRPVKAARYFGGHEHEQAVQQLAIEHKVPADFYTRIEVFYGTPVESAYAVFMDKLMEKQAASIRLALGSNPPRRLFVDGGFSKNTYFMKRLAHAFPDMEVYAAEVAQATALGAALALHQAWNKQALPDKLITYHA